MKRKIALVGIGKIARDQHIPALAASDDWELAAAVSRNAKVDGVPNFDSVEAMLAAHPEIGTVSLCTPPGPRFRQAACVLNAGRHLMLEKPPGATLAEVMTLEAMARAAGLTLYATWHSREAAFVAQARDWLAGRTLRRLTVTWKEDVRKWHPGQDWVFRPGGMGVFDPGINALSIVTAILADPVHLVSADLIVPENCETPIAAELTFAPPSGAEMGAVMDWDHQGQDIWDIAAETDDGTMLLRHGGALLLIDGVERAEGQGGLAGEYPRLYANMARLVASGRSDVDIRPMVHVCDALALGRRKSAAAFRW